jgi:hypothetical protein
MPLLDAPADASKFGMVKAALRRIFNIDLVKCRFSTAGAGEIVTATSGCMILHHLRGSMASRLIAKDSSLVDGSVNAIISAPISIVKYMKFLFGLMSRTVTNENLPGSIGYLRSPVIEVEPETIEDVWIDGEKKTHTPLRCEVKPLALRTNVGPGIRAEKPECVSCHERVEIDHLPRGKELEKAWKRERIPLFSYA